MKNILILGPSRSGKSTLAYNICKKYSLEYISGDSIRNAFIKIYPEIGYTVKNTINRIDFCSFIKTIIRENCACLKKKCYYVVESADISIENAIKIFNDYLIICVGCGDISSEKLKNNIRQYDTELDWTKQVDDKELLLIANEIVARSKKMAKESEVYQIKYFDTSLNREKIYEDIYKYLDDEFENSNL